MRSAEQDSEQPRASPSPVASSSYACLFAPRLPSPILHHELSVPRVAADARPRSSLFPPLPPLFVLPLTQSSRVHRPRPSLRPHTRVCSHPACRRPSYITSFPFRASLPTPARDLPCFLRFLRILCCLFTVPEPFADLLLTVARAFPTSPTHVPSVGVERWSRHTLYTLHYTHPLHTTYPPHRIVAVFTLPHS